MLDSCLFMSIASNGCNRFSCSWFYLDNVNSREFKSQCSKHSRDDITVYKTAYTVSITAKIVSTQCLVAKYCGKTIPIAVIYDKVDLISIFINTTNQLYEWKLSEIMRNFRKMKNVYNHDFTATFDLIE